MDDLLADFLTETSESLAELDTALVKLERTPNDEETLSLIFRMVHTIKGTCGFLGLSRLERVAHAAENVLGRVRDKVLKVTPENITTILAALDCIKQIVEALAATAQEPAGNDTALIAALDAAAEGRVLVTAPSAIASSAIATPAIATPAITPMPEPVAEAASVDAPAGEAQIGAQTIRVGVDVLEDLMTLVSELVLTRNQLLQLARMHEAQSDEASGFTVPLQRLSHITSDLQEGVMKTRMQPIGNAWQKLPRLVRDLARDVDKRIELVMRGAETELDRQVLELIKDPLTHMVRNSGDHGLEKAEARRAAGKPETGRITLNAYHEGGHIIIEVADDGAGLHIDRIRAKILSKGLASEGELAAMSGADIQRFIFHAGFSTAAQVTAVSGRGVGMDVVKTNIEKIGGTIDLKSEPGRGTTFTIKIPLTLAIVSALIVEAGGERFAIPQISVVELVRARLSADGQDSTTPVVEHIQGTPVLRLRDQLLPLVNLTDLLALSSSKLTSASPGHAEHSVHVVVAQVGSALLGIIVDRVFDTEEIVVKPVAPILRHITMFSGNTILGDGSVIMILDPNGIARATGVAGSSGGDRGRDSRDAALPSTRSNPNTAMLLFRAGGTDPKAVPLGLVARLEDLPRDKIETSAGQPVTQYRGRLMPLVPFSGAINPDAERYAVLVFTDGDGNQERCMGLLVDEIIDVVEDHLNIELSGDRPGLLGTAVIAGRATDVIDIGYWLTQASQDWFRRSDRQAGQGGNFRAHILVVEDSDFFRQLLVPTLSAAGYRVTAAADAGEALRLREAGVMFDAVVSDIEMPGIDGHALVRQLRAAGAWAQLPMIALTSHTSPDRIDAARNAGFTDYVAKFEREALLASLEQCLAAVSGAGPGATPAGGRRLASAA